MDKVLLVDNDREFLAARRKILEMHGYEVHIAETPDSALQMLGAISLALAVIDLRLEDDLDENDYSGLNLIQKAPSRIPKILTTGFPTVELARRALKGYHAYTSLALDIVAKTDSPQAFLASVNEAIQRGKSLK
ncbi:MAG: response regulator [Calditrichaeota bacterium]|nr:response regulator [Calditrichota bacterium]MCB9090070.1 response regulator [Calditrichia bacterium]MCB0289466.1 response regulator [Calditrichota bacterium]MCB0297574.1 response regulator [Calditrichota bacterium]MCB0303859.1 response regulator [Calditrichota bacterium]